MTSFRPPFLLDTNILLWSLLEPARLSERVAAAVADPQNELWLSPIVIWEVLMLAERGRLSLEPDAQTWVRRAFQAVPFREAPMNYEVAIQSLRPHARDRRRASPPLANDRVARKRVMSRRAKTRSRDPKAASLEARLAKLAAQGRVTLPTRTPLKRIRMVRIADPSISRTIIEDRR